MTNIVLPGLTDDEQRLLTGLVQQLEAKRSRNELRNSYYEGKRAISLVGTIIPPQYYKLAIVLGWSAKAVDTLADRCNLDGFVWPDGDLKSLGYQEVFEGNYLAMEVPAAQKKSFIHGVSFLVNTVGVPEAGEPLGAIHVKTAENATGTWNERAHRLDNLLSITSRDKSGQPDGIALYLDGEIVTGRRDESGWSSEVTSHPWGVPCEPVPYNYLPDRPFGSSRISRTVMSMHDGALRTVIRMEAHADVYSIPDMWLLGADSSSFKNADGTPKAEWQVVMGRIKGLLDNEDAPEGLQRADVKHFPASSPQPHIDQLKQQAMIFSGETSIPLSSLGVSDMSNPTSADSYIASREDLIARAESAMAEITRPLRRTMQRALAMANGLSKIPDEWATIAPKWRSPLYLSRAAEADAGLKLYQADPSLQGTEVGYELLGLDQQQIDRVMAAHRRASVTDLVTSTNAAATAARQNPAVAELAGRTRG